MSGDPHVIARNVRATRSTVEAIAAHFGIELDEHGEPVEPRPATLTEDELDALPLYTAVLCVDEYRHVYLALKVGTPQGSGGHTWRTTDYATIPGSGRLAGDNAVLLDRGLTALVLMGFAQDAALAASPVQADALTEVDQVPDVVHARHEPIVGHSRHDAPRDIPSSPGGPVTTPALARATEAVREAWGDANIDGYGDEGAGYDESVLAHAAVSAALHDPDDDVIARTLREHGIRGSSGTGREPWTSSCWAPGCDWRGDSSSHPAHQADAVRAAILGARGEASAS